MSKIQVKDKHTDHLDHSLKTGISRLQWSKIQTPAELDVPWDIHMSLWFPKIKIFFDNDILVKNRNQNETI